MSEVFRVGLLTVSDRAFRKEYEDLGGPAMHKWLSEALVSPWDSVEKVVPDEQTEIEQALIAMADDMHCNMILTTGGTGPAPRDVTPEATLAVADKVLPGFGERMRGVSLQYVPTAILSRQVGVIRGTTLIVNLPGNPKSIAEILDVLFESIPYCIQLMEGPYIETNPAVVEAFRPRHARKI